MPPKPAPMTVIAGLRRTDDLLVPFRARYRRVPPSPCRYRRPASPRSPIGRGRPLKRVPVSVRTRPGAPPRVGALRNRIAHRRPPEVRPDGAGPRVVGARPVTGPGDTPERTAMAV